jgi:hypothetical protein
MGIELKKPNPQLPQHFQGLLQAYMKDHIFSSREEIFLIAIYDLQWKVLNESSLGQTLVTLTN